MKMVMMICEMMMKMEIERAREREMVGR